MRTKLEKQEITVLYYNSGIIRETQKKDAKFKRHTFGVEMIDPKTNQIQEFKAKFNANVDYEPVWIQEGKKLTLDVELVEDKFEGKTFRYIEIPRDSLIAIGLGTKDNFNIYETPKKYKGYGSQEIVE